MAKQARWRNGHEDSERISIARGGKERKNKGKKGGRQSAANQGGESFLLKFGHNHKKGREKSPGRRTGISHNFGVENTSGLNRQKNDNFLAWGKRGQTALSL